MDTIDSLTLDHNVKLEYGTRLKELWLEKMRIKDLANWVEHKKLGVPLNK